MKKYIVHGNYAHIQSKGECIASSLYNLCENEGINCGEYDLEKLEKELDKNGHVVLGDYRIIGEEI